MSESQPRPPSEAVETELARALTRAEEGDWGEAANILLGVLEDDPENAHLLCWLGVAERELGLEGLAYDHFKQAVALGPTDPALLATAGSGLAAFDDPDAEGVLRTAALLGSDIAQTRWSYGAYLSREGMIEPALAELDAAAALDPEDAVIQVERGVALALGGDPLKAAASFERAVELDPDDGWALVLLGLARLEAGESEDALRPLEDGARLRSEDVEAQALAALSLAAAGWEDRALELLEAGRLAGAAGDEGLIEQVQDRIDEGQEAAGRFLAEVLAPSAFRERLMERP
jgi:tetratricopeptide (TPR) repeat protein